MVDGLKLYSKGIEIHPNVTIFACIIKCELKNNVMKHVFCSLIIAMLLFGLSSCSSYYYSILSSNDSIGTRNNLGDFVQETDTVSISYSFNGEDAPISITIYNKLNEPLFIDWTRSALIVDDVANVYYDGPMSVEGMTESVFLDNTSWGSFSGAISLPKGVSFIPPGSRIEESPLKLANFPYDKISNEEYLKEDVPVRNGTVSVRTKEFTEENSPLYFRSYLTLYTGDHNGKQTKSMFFERSFYVSKLIKAGNLPPVDFSEQQQQAGDFFYIHNVKGTKAGLIIGSVAVAVGCVSIGIALGTEGEDLDIGF